MNLHNYRLTPWHEQYTIHYKPSPCIGATGNIGEKPSDDAISFFLNTKIKLISPGFRKFTSILKIEYLWLNWFQKWQRKLLVSEVNLDMLRTCSIVVSSTDIAVVLFMHPNIFIVKLALCQNHFLVTVASTHHRLDIAIYNAATRIFTDTTAVGNSIDDVH